MCVTSAGALQINIVSASSVFSATSAGGGFGSINPYSSAGLHHWVMGYDLSDNSLSIYVDGAPALVGDTTVSAANLIAADASVAYGPAIGGRPPTSNVSLVATKTNRVHAYGFAGLPLPANIGDLVTRLYRHPRLVLRDEDIEF